MAKYDKIGKNYNQTRKADPYIISRMQDLLDLEANRDYLDVGCGTGNYTVALSKSYGNWTGMDPSEIMLEKARSKSSDIKWIKGSAESIPSEANLFDGVLASLTTHHWTDLKKGFSEIRRVLKPEGKFLIFTATREQMRGYWLNHYFPEALKLSTEEMPDIKMVAEILTDLGFQLEYENYVIRPDLEDLFMLSGKHRPELYLRPEVINGISTFSNLATSEELESGLNQLKSDIESGRIDEIIGSYENDIGDYLFLKGSL